MAKTKKGSTKTTAKKIAAKKGVNKKAVSKVAATRNATKKATSTQKKASSKASANKAKLAKLLAAPEHSLPATGGQWVNLSELRGKKVVLFFYPKDMTPGCTIEGHEFTKLKPEFESRNTVVFGVSRDSVKSHEKFKAQESYTVDLLADEDEKLCQHFKVIKDKNMYGKTVKGIERSTFVLNENGEIEKEWRGVTPAGHAQAVLDYIKSV